MSKIKIFTDSPADVPYNVVQELNIGLFPVKILFRILTCQSHSILSLTATQLKDNRIIVAEEIPAPISLHRVVTVQHLGGRWLDQTLEGLVFLEFSQFIFSHFVAFLQILRLRSG